jgi:hypothetical protein
MKKVLLEKIFMIYKLLFARQNLKNLIPIHIEEITSMVSVAVTFLTKINNS